MKLKNKETKKIFRIIKMTFFLMLILYMIPGYLIEVENGLNSNLPSNVFLHIVYFIIWMLCEIFVFIKNLITNNLFGTVLICLFFIFCRKFILNNSEKLYYKEKTDISDVNDESYYRDIIRNYSPSVLSYINDFELGIKDVVATLMSLELKKKIKIGKNLEIINKDVKNLSLNEMYVLENINEKNVLEINMQEFERIVKEDCMKSGLLSEMNSTGNMLLRGLFYLTSLVICDGIINYITIDGQLSRLVVACLQLYIYVTPFLYIVSMVFKWLMHLSDPYKRTKKATLINKKINGLKRFINDFSNLDEREYKHIKLWNEYLIYSVIIGDNEKIVNQIKKMINN